VWSQAHLLAEYSMRKSTFPTDVVAVRCTPTVTVFSVG
jgi:hypothetical protein